MVADRFQLDNLLSGLAESGPQSLAHQSLVKTLMEINYLPTAPPAPPPSVARGFLVLMAVKTALEKLGETRAALARRLPQGGGEQSDTRYES